MKITAVRIALLAIWVCSLAAPSLVTIYHDEETSTFVMNLGEEEQEEQGNKDLGEEKIIPSYPYSRLAVFSNNNNSSSDNYILGRFNFSLDIALPPPEQLI
ncbi:MAG: hypothetical protein KJN76_08585 [Eudoraea sp.]|nr:hypothetical protein [Eudoraea sp.]